MYDLLVESPWVCFFYKEEAAEEDMFTQIKITWECVHEKTRQNQAGGDNAQITDFAQTRHKC